MFSRLVVSSSKIDGEETGGVGQEADTTHDVSVSGGESDVVNVEVSRSLTGRKVKRYLQLYGHEGRANDVIYAPPLSKEYLETDVQSSTRDHDQDRLMIYFGGDLQVRVLECSFEYCTRLDGFMTCHFF